MALTKSSEKERTERNAIYLQEMQAIYDHFGQVLDDDVVPSSPV
jgi:hypothetical protein